MRMMGTVNSYVKNLALFHRANKRLQNPYSLNSTSKKPNAPDLDHLQISGKINAIVGKLKSGKKLSTEELLFLREHDPATYEKAIKISKEREMHKKNLEHCRSKEEVQRTQLGKMQELRAASKSDSPETVEMRLAAVNEEYSRFVSSSDYQSLPDRDNEIRNEKKSERADLTESVTQEHENLFETKRAMSETALPWQLNERKSNLSVSASRMEEAKENAGESKQRQSQVILAYQNFAKKKKEQ